MNDFDKFAEKYEVEIESKVVDPGTYKTSSKWEITLKVNNREAIFDWTAGSAHRHFTSSLFCGTVSSNRKTVDFMGKNYQVGDPLPFTYGKGFTIHDVEVLENCTAPTPPTVGEVLECLQCDFTCVCDGQTYDDFCDGFYGPGDVPREAYHIYQALLENERKIRRLFTTEQLEELLNSEGISK